MGSWKIMEISLLRRSRMSWSVAFRRSLPSKRISPAAIFPGGVEIRRMMLSAVVVFPAPVSPTRPTVLPASILRSMPLTARMTLLRVVYWT